MIANDGRATAAACAIVDRLGLCLEHLLQCRSLLQRRNLLLEGLQRRGKVIWRVRW